MLAKRKRLSRQFVEKASGEICSKVLKMHAVSHAKLIGIYISIGNEVRAEKLLGPLLRMKKTVAVPVLRGKGMKFAVLDSIKDTHMERGIRVPNSKAFVAGRSIGVFVVPGVAFDTNGIRIGFGKGYYDRFLSRVPGATKIGVAYDFQVVNRIGKEAHDIPMGFVVTEKRMLM